MMWSSLAGGVVYRVVQVGSSLLSKSQSRLLLFVIEKARRQHDWDSRYGQLSETGSEVSLTRVGFYRVLQVDPCLLSMVHRNWLLVVIEKGRRHYD